MTSKCEDCKFFDEIISDNSIGFGLCHRYPPMREPKHKYSLFPRVSVESYCGEWQQKAIYFDPRVIAEKVRKGRTR